MRMFQGRAHQLKVIESIPADIEQRLEEIRKADDQAAETAEMEKTHNARTSI